MECELPSPGFNLLVDWRFETKFIGMLDLESVLRGLLYRLTGSKTNRCSLSQSSFVNFKISDLQITLDWTLMVFVL